MSLDRAENCWICFEVLRVWLWWWFSVKKSLSKMTQAISRRRAHSDARQACTHQWWRGGEEFFFTPLAPLKGGRRHPKKRPFLSKKFKKVYSGPSPKLVQWWWFSIICFVFSCFFCEVQCKKYAASSGMWEAWSLDNSYLLSFICDVGYTSRGKLEVWERFDPYCFFKLLECCLDNGMP